MELFAPRYYLDFACIADRCRHSCCIGWEIDVDEETLLRYERLDGAFGERLRQSICREEVPHFALAEGERCPLLAKNGLCEIILHCGEDFLCEICREHPRFYHTTAHCMEVGLGMACEEAARIILSSPDYATFVKVGEEPGELPFLPFDATRLRKKVYDCLSDDSLSYRERLLRIYRDFDVSPAILDNEAWRELLAELEYLDETHRERILSYSSAPSEREALSPILARALAYFVFRHCSDATDEVDFQSALGLSLFCERLLSSMLDHPNATLSDAVSAARILSEELEYSEDNTARIRCVFE